MPASTRVRTQACASSSQGCHQPVEVADRWRSRYGITIVEGYGLSETSPAATFNHECEHRPGSVGTAVDVVDMRVVDDEDREVAS